MKKLTKGLCALFTCSLIAGLFPVDAVQLATLSILNSPVQSAEQSIPVERYSHQPLADIFVHQDHRMVNTAVNEVSMGANLKFTASHDHVTIYVSVLTDLDGDGYYEWVDSLGADTTYLLSPNGSLVSASTSQQQMKAGQTRTLSASELLRVGMESEQFRVADGPTPFYGLTLSNSGDLMYYITVCHQDSANEHYYFKLNYALDPTVSNDKLGAGLFQDVPSWAWYWDEVDWAVRAGILNGSTATTFLPDASTTRGALMQVLYAMADSPEVKLANFSDVKSGDWYADAVSWGAKQGLVNGYPNGSFQPNAPITREQLAVIVYKAAQQSGTSVKSSVTDLSAFSDGTSTSSWAKTAVCWAVDVGILDAQDGGLLNPQSTVSRATLAAVLMTLDGMS